MAKNKPEIDEYGDKTLLEVMLYPFFKDESQKKLKPTNDTKQDEELDLAKLLSSPDAQEYFQSQEDLLPDDKVDSGSDSDGKSVEILFQRGDLLYEKSLPTKEISEGKTNILSDLSTLQMQKRTPFLQSQNDVYRKFMEELMLIKCCSKQIIELLENAKITLEKYIEVINDPGLNKVCVIQAWIWILKESIVLSYSSASKDRKRRKQLETFLSENIGSLEESYRQLHRDIKKTLKTFQKVEVEFAELVKRSEKMFVHNLEAARQYELGASGYNFLFHQSEGDSQTSVLQENEDIGGSEDKWDKQMLSELSLLVRCSVDGITVRSGKTGRKWHKFQSVDQDKDKQVLMKIFANELLSPCTEVSKEVMVISELMEVRNAQRKLAKESIFHSLSNCQELLRSSKMLSFLPKEQVILLYSLNSARVTLELVNSRLAELVIVESRVHTVIEDFHKQRKLLKVNSKIGRIPLHRHSKLEINVQNTKVNIDLVLNRYPNLYDAKKMRERIINKLADGGDISKELVIEEPQIDILYKCQSQVFSSPSTQEMISMLRKLITEQIAVSINPNPAHLLFADLGEEYKEMTTALTETRLVTPEILNLCSDPIRRFYLATQDLSEFKSKMLNYVISSVENLLYTDSFDTDLPGGHVPTSFWIQIICKAVHVWDFHSLPKHLQRHFQSVSETSVKWVEALEETYSELSKHVREFKEDFIQYYDNVERVHAFSTWIRKKYQFNPPNKIISKWKQEVEELTQQRNSDGSSSDQEYSSYPTYRIDFHVFDMELVQINMDKSKTVLLSLTKSSGNVQVGFIAVLFTYLDQIISRAIVNLNSALSILKRSISVKKLQSSFIPLKKLSSTLYRFHQLEDMVVALSFERLHKEAKEMVAFIGLLNGSITQFKQMFEMIKLQIEDRGINTSVKYDENDGTSSKTRLSKREAQETDHLNHDVYLNETFQILRASVDAMPNKFEISEDSIKHSLLYWVKQAEKDLHVREFEKSQPDEGERDSLDPEMKEESSHASLLSGDSSTELLPINFEEAMMQTTTGKAFFPDPLQFNANIECWRAVCFKMLATALDKFREIVTSKIKDTRRTLCQPRVFKHNFMEEERVEFEIIRRGLQSDDKINGMPDQATDSVNLEHVGKEKNEESKILPVGVGSEGSAHKIGFIEELCSLLCFIVRRLTPKDRLLVNRSDLKSLKNKLFAVTSLMEKFQKELDAMEKVLVNNLGLAMTSVEYKRIPQHLPVLWQDEEFLKSHDLDEVASRDNVNESTGKEDGDFSDDTGTNISGKSRLGRILLHWDSTNRNKLMCKGSSDDSTWLELGQLNTSGQLHLIYIVIDELIREFEKARELVRESKLDITCAKKLLEKTWKGIGKDMKRGRIPDSGILVLIKLYRYQIATAVLDTKVIKRTAREVRFLLSQSAQLARLWSSEDGHQQKLASSLSGNKNYVMSLDNFSFTVLLRTSAPTRNWCTYDGTKNVKEVIESAPLHESGTTEAFPEAETTFSDLPLLPETQPVTLLDASNIANTSND